MNNERCYRFVSGGRGIYEAVAQDCPGDDARRHEKPDGSWLQKMGKEFPQSVSFWTETGLQRYMTSGLLRWHSSVVNEPVVVQVVSRPTEDVLYQDEYQIILEKRHAPTVSPIPLETFLLEYA